MEVLRKRKTEVLARNRKGSLEYLTFPALTETGAVTHLFTTRVGGVSRGIFESMNLSDSRGDNPEAVKENYRRIAEILCCKPADMVLSKQTHTTNIRVVTWEDAGKGVVRDRGYDDVDGLVTEEEGLVLGTLFADCVPLFMVDPVRRAIGLSHSGWRGTVGKMGLLTIQRMQEAFGTKPEDVLAAIGPSICKDCYEVSEDVIEQVREAFGEAKSRELLYTEMENGKYLLDLWEANRQVFLEAGVLAEHISVTDICTCCNPDYLFSHRASKGKRGNLAAFMKLNRK